MDNHIISYKSRRGVRIPADVKEFIIEVCEEKRVCKKVAPLFREALAAV